jgi:endonuclease YncB( thermonuclease family)
MPEINCFSSKYLLYNNIMTEKPKHESKSRPTRQRRPLTRRTRRLITLAVVSALLALFGADRLGYLPTSIPTDQARYRNKTFTVIKVVDGDTIDLDVVDLREQKPHTRVRLWGVDTPETRHPTRGVMYYGPKAGEFTKKLVLHQRVRVELEPFENTRGKYRRLLGYIYLPDGRCLNEQLIIHGYAYADERFAHMFRSKYLQMQKQAQREERGLWKNVQPHQWPDWYRRRHERKTKRD